MNTKIRGLLVRVPQTIVSIIVCILALRHYRYVGFIPLYVLIIVVCAGAANEIAALVYHHARPNQRERPTRLVTVACGALPPLLMAIIVLSRRTVAIFDFPATLLFGMVLFVIQLGIMIVYIISIETELRKGGADMTHTTHTTSQLSAYYVTTLYIGLPAAILIVFTAHTIGTILILCAVILTAVFDTFSYLCGITFAKKSSILAVSPRKSIAGYLGGSIITLIVMLAFISTTRVINLSVTRTLLITSVTIAIAVVGDLFESSLKRVAQKKDSGKLVAGRGGLLDSIDSHLVAIPSFCALCVWAL